MSFLHSGRKNWQTRAQALIEERLSLYLMICSITSNGTLDAIGRKGLLMADLVAAVSDMPHFFLKMLFSESQTLLEGKITGMSSLSSPLSGKGIGENVKKEGSR
jgi:hypothetical protein